MESITNQPLFCIDGISCKSGKLKALEKTLWKDTLGAKIYENSKEWLKVRPNNSITTKWASKKEFEANELVKNKWGIDAMAWLIDRDSESRNSFGYTYSWFYDLIIEASKKNKHSPEFLHAVAMGEGMNGISRNSSDPPHAIALYQKIAAEDIRSDDTSTSSGTTRNHYNSFTDCGLDNFQNNKESLIKNGYLDKLYADNEHCISLDNEEYYNEEKPRRQVFPSKLVGLNTAIFAISAELQNRTVMAKKDFLDTGNNKELSRDALEFIAYAKYNAQPSAFQDVINRFESTYFKKLNNITISSDKTVKHNAIVKLATADFFRILNIYEGYSTKFTKTLKVYK